MAKTDILQESSTSDRQETEGKGTNAPSHTPQGLQALRILFLIILLGLFVLGFNGVLTYEKDITRSNFIVPGAIPIPVLEMHPAKGETEVVAIIAHGFAGNKELMSGMGVELAKDGITTYLLDLPGHGASTVPLKQGDASQVSQQDNVKAISAMVDYARTHNKASKEPKIILLGHSMGAAAIAEYAVAHPDADDLVATILISPVGNATPTVSQPRNLLMLVGENDLASSISNTQRLLKAGCNYDGHQKKLLDCGSPNSETGRRAVVLTGQNHITIINAHSTFQEIVNWLQKTDSHVKDNNQYSDTRLLWLLLGVVSILLAMFPLITLLVDIFELHPTPQPLKGRDILMLAPCLLIAIAAALAIQSNWRPFSFLHLLVADYIVGYFFCMTGVVLLLSFIVRGSIPLAPFKQVSRQMLLGLLLASCLYLTLGQLVSFAWESFTFTAPRFWRFLLVFLLVLPLFLLDEGIARGYQEQGRWRGIASSLVFKGLLVVGLFIAVAITPGLGFLSIVLPLLVLFFLALVSFGTQIYSSGRAALASALLSAFMLAWFMSTTLPII